MTSLPRGDKERKPSRTAQNRQQNDDDTRPTAGAQNTRRDAIPREIDDKPETRSVIFPGKWLSLTQKVSSKFGLRKSALNLAVAGSLLLYEVYRARSARRRGAP
jgi:hypothetical protein